MFKFLRKLWRDRRGNALIIAGAALPLIVGSAGLASDTIQWTLWKRQLQRVADSAAMAGVRANIRGNAMDDCSGVASATYTTPVAYDVRKNMHLPQTPVCAATNPPSSGGYTSDNNAVKVVVSMQRALSFSGIFLSAAPTITASATATIVPGGKYCVVSLENTSVTGITATGNANVDLGCGMITNSTSLTAAVATGSSDVNASPIAAVGGIAASNNWASGTVLQPFTIPQADPFANVNPPASTTYPSGNCPNLTESNPHTVMNASDFVSGTTYGAMTGASAGAMCFGNISISGTVNFPAGSVIVLDGGSLSIGAQASVTCSGCTFILTNRSTASAPTIGTVGINGGANLNLSAPGTSATGIAANYEGIMMYQDRRAQDGNNANFQSTINGNATSFLQGAIYFPSQQVQFNGTAGMSTHCLQLVARRVYYSGNLDISNSCPADSGANAFTGKLVRLVE
ncbi:MAG TPA: pilus assembly protein TadG-related protein [Sphingomicrobium sp.]|nr:pilus assembly protein TadG-related protein [Sphingomicrobium sp.]